MLNIHYMRIHGSRVSIRKPIGTERGKRKLALQFALMSESRFVKWPNCR